MRQQIMHFATIRQAEQLRDGFSIITWQSDWTKNRWTYQLRVINPLGCVVFAGSYSQVDYATRELQQQRAKYR